ncbi:Molecular chaperone DnaJ [Spraguea lophii 42_110]|uniref:Molecular chaperone DnaJ n=1 Tax=Spraguea lophii (strain 42_110) TaxID=1358809 RepID=S7WA04_SPRLO|nr:Molecular chaperone DnaJ [Spraguea lophii 42_110]
MLKRIVNLFLPSKKLTFQPEMTVREAHLILNTQNRDKKSIYERYKILQNINHPDKKGSAYISSKINEAKNILTEEYDL